MPEAAADRAFVLGLDGVPWGKVRDWIDDGHLPNFERLRETGAAGRLESTTPPTTPLAWPTIATGAWPDKHGIYWFQQLQRDYTKQMATSRDVDQPTLWDLVSPAVVGNVPLTYPAEPIDGELVAGMMTPELDEQFTHPSALHEDIREAIPEYEVGLSWSEYAGRPDEFVADLEDLVSARRRLMRLLMDREDWRLFFFVYTAPDRLQHLLWDDEVLLDHYRDLDDILGEVMTYAAERGANLFVVSDHGFGPVEKQVSVNRVLEEAGYLARRESDGVRSLFSKLGVSRDDVLSLLEGVGVDEETLVRALPRRFVDGVAGQLPGSHALYDVDFSLTRAFVHGPGCVYVNDAERFEGGVVDPRDRDAVAADVAEVFRAVTDPETDEQVLCVYDGADLFPTDDASPDLVVRAVDGYRKVTSLGSDVFASTGATQADHRSEGVFFARGPSIDAGGTPESASVVDVAPTLLHSIGEPVPAAADGEVLDGVLSEERAVTERDVATAGGSDDPSTDEDFAEVEERLRGLGYVD